ncbi:MAG: S8 family serine peptidase [Saprospiraceae bacterium]
MKIPRIFFGLLSLLLPWLATSQGGMEKCSPAIRGAERSIEKHRFLVVVRDLPDFLNQLKHFAPEVEIVRSYTPAGIVEVFTDWSTLKNRVLPLPDVRYADQAEIECLEELPVPGQNLFINKINGLQAKFPDWNGAGRTVSIKELLFDTLDIDLRGRVAPVIFGAGQLSPHAALMATLVAGAGNSGPAGRGVARGARVAASDFSGLLPDDEIAYSTQNISVQNHSYGVGIENYYGAGALAYDQTVVNHPALLHVFSAGNFGDSSATVGTYPGLKGFANLSGSFKMAKNVLLAGAVDSFGQLRPFSSRGPAYDGRIKPDLVAFGQDGSSGAAALVSGLAAVLQQGYAEKKQGVLPQAALVRALLINGADDAALPGPDFETGFGNLNAVHAAQMLDQDQFVESAIGPPDTFQTQLSVPSGSGLLKVTLAWDDLPAAPGAKIALVNDLDLTVIGPDNQTRHPLVLNTAPATDSLKLPAVPGLDTLNTVEQVVVKNPEPGIYQVAVRARKLTNAAQAFALAYQWLPATSFNWITPARSTPFVSGTNTVLYWEAHTDTPAAGQLAFRYIGQAVWQLIDDQVPLQTGTCRWETPDTLALVQLRMTIDGQPYLSDSFLLAPEPVFDVGFSCPDSALIYWRALAPQAVYQIWGLGSRYLEPLFTTSDTLAVLERALFPQDRIAISALAAPDFSGIRSNTLAISQQGLDCYFKNLLATFDQQAHVQLQLNLGSTHFVRQISLEKWQPTSGFGTIASWQAPFFDFQGLQFEAIDATPSPGPNRYRALVEFSGGASTASDTVILHYGGQKGFWVYPNPAAGHELLQIVVQDPGDDVLFVLFDAFGRFLLETALTEPLVAIQLPALAPGIYPFAIREGGRWIYHNKLVIGK